MDHNKMDAIRGRVKNRRLELGLSLQDVAQRTGMSKSTLQRYETGSIKNLPLDKLDTLAKALETTPQDLMGWSRQEDAEFRAFVDSGLIGSDQTRNQSSRYHDFEIDALKSILVLNGVSIKQNGDRIYVVDEVGNGGALQEEVAIKIAKEIADYAEFLVSKQLSIASTPTELK